MVPQHENFGNISVNVYEIRSFPKFDERNPGTTFSMTTNPSFATLYFKLNEVKSYLRSTQCFAKHNVLYVNIWSINVNLKT